MVAQRPREVATEASYGRYALEATRGTSYLATYREPASASIACAHDFPG